MRRTFGTPSGNLPSAGAVADRERVRIAGICAPAVDDSVVRIAAPVGRQAFGLDLARLHGIHRRSSYQEQRGGSRDRVEAVGAAHLSEAGGQRRHHDLVYLQVVDPHASADHVDDRVGRARLVEVNLVGGSAVRPRASASIRRRKISSAPVAHGAGPAHRPGGSPRDRTTARCGSDSSTPTSTLRSPARWQRDPSRAGASTRRPAAALERAAKELQPGRRGRREQPRIMSPLAPFDASMNRIRRE